MSNSPGPEIIKRAGYREEKHYMKNKILSFLIGMTMAATILSSGCVVYAASGAEDAALSGENTDELTASDTLEHISLTETAAGKDEADLSAPAEEDISYTGIEPDQAPGDHIEENGFYGEINDDGKTCTVSGFENPGDVKTLNIPGSISGYTVTVISSYSFRYESKYTGTLTIPASVTKIGEQAFFNCTGFDKLVFASTQNLKEIGASAFYGCTGLKGELSLPRSLTSIGNQAFGSDSKLSGKLKLPPNLVSLGGGVFNGCEKFTGTLTIPASLKNAADSALDGLYGINIFINNSKCKFPAIYVIPDAYGELVKSDGSVRLSRSQGSIEKGTYYRCYTKLDKPKDISAENTGKGVKIKWKKSEGANAYYIKRNDWKEPKLLKDVKTYTDKTAVNGKTYTYKVRAYNKLTRSQSGWASVKTCFLEKSAKPEAKNNAKGKIKVTWKKNGKCNGYEVSYGRKSDFTDAVTKSVNKSKLTLTLTNLKKNKNYYIRVRSYKKASKVKYYSAWSEKVKVKVKK